MNMDQYQKATEATVVYPKKNDMEYLGLGLGSEVGEVLASLKRMLRDDSGRLTPERLKELDDEMGDALWYLARLAARCNLTLSGIARRNLAKLEKRRLAGTLHGKGNR